jgi:hypothetical protein
MVPMSWLAGKDAGRLTEGKTRMTDLFSIPHTRRVAERLPAEALPKAPRLFLSREQVVDQILTINRSATADYLSQFGEPQLNNYLDHLINTQGPRGRDSRWDRPGDAPAIMTRRRAS